MRPVLGSEEWRRMAAQRQENLVDHGESCDILEPQIVFCSRDDGVGHNSVPIDGCRNAKTTRRDTLRSKGPKIGSSRSAE